VIGLIVGVARPVEDDGERGLVLLFDDGVDEGPLAVGAHGIVARIGRARLGHVDLEEGARHAGREGVAVGRHRHDHQLSIA
jgi:hypothetical protein